MHVYACLLDHIFLWTAFVVPPVEASPDSAASSRDELQIIGDNQSNHPVCVSNLPLSSGPGQLTHVEQF
jgi:hypothetical protein